MKASRLFTGYDTFGRRVELAQGINGEWFGRSYDFNGYGKAWGKWLSHDKPSFESHGTNQYTGEKFQYDKPQAFWGFNRMDECDSIPRYRLPD